MSAGSESVLEGAWPLSQQPRGLCLQGLVASPGAGQGAGGCPFLPAWQCEGCVCNCGVASGESDPMGVSAGT